MALIGLYNLLNSEDLGTPFWIHMLTAVATFGISFFGTIQQIKRFNITAGIFYVLLCAATFFPVTQLEIADFALHLLIGPG